MALEDNDISSGTENQNNEKKKKIVPVLCEPFVRGIRISSHESTA